MSQIFEHPSPTRKQSAFTMKTLLIFSVILCAALSIRGAVVGPTEAAAVDQEDKSEPKQARLQFCLDGWLSYRGSCYYIENYPDTWRNAESFCAGFGGTLASVHNIWEYQFLQRMVKTAGHAFAWIGGYYFEGEWRWGDGSMFNYHNWDSFSSADQYQCLQLNSQVSKGWSNHGCSMPFPFICQVKPNC
ncbi:snaclec A7-like isoform X1 [Acanthopagrus latus]|uniref:snaclec A7-like isoform X1 n=2 Tax=Acanthopagrus latus TaxID=8177 RepID=UPI00187C94FC|nr:snaclec A7-like isoform X1 [Acanthopagrus latus]